MSFTKLCSLCLIFIIISCAQKKEKEEVLLAPEVLYQNSSNALEQRKYLLAAEGFAKIYLEHPASKLATKAKMMEGLCYYQKQDFDMTIAILDEFIKLHPAYDEISYAYYLRAMSYYSQISDSKHDQEQTMFTKAAINEMLLKFPHDEYSRELKFKLDLVNDHLAGNEMEVGRFYQKNNDLISAINRFNMVVNEYATTNHIAEALARLVECYLVLGIKDEAQKNAAILGVNYPGSSWYQHSYELLKKF
jgi:outer membrane protein assembly factor BamD